MTGRRDRGRDVTGGRRRTGWFGLVAVIALALGGALVPTAAHAATGITLTSAAATSESGVATTFTLTVSCSTDGGCTQSRVAIPTTTITGTPSITDFGSWIGASSCSDVTRTVSAGEVVFDYGTLPTGSRQCTFTVRAPEYRTFDNTVATLTATLTSSNAASSTSAPVTYTATAGHNNNIGNSTPTRAIAGSNFDYTITYTCGENSEYTGDIGVSALDISATLPANFEYQSYRLRNNLPGTVSYDPVTRVFRYSDPTGASCGNPPLNISNAIVIYVTGSASIDGTPAPVGSQICNAASASWTYLDGVTASRTAATVCSTVSNIATRVDKSTSSYALNNIGQYPAADGGARAAYTYPGNWDGTGSTSYFDISVATVPATANAGIAYAVTEPLPCLANGSNNNYTSNAPGDLCQNPAYIPTLIIPTGFTVTTADSITVVYTDGSDATIPYTTGRGWVIPTSPTVAEVQVPPFASQGANASSSMRLRVVGYAAPSVPAPAVLTNRASSTPHLAGDSQPLLDPQTATSRLLVVQPPADSGALVYPGLTTVRSGTTCNVNLNLNSSTNSAYSTRIEIPTAPSQAVYIDYLAPAGTVAITSTTSNFTFQSYNNSGTRPTFPVSGVTATTTPDYNGTGRTLIRWTIPAGAVTQPGYYQILSSTLAAITLEPGCAGTYTSDITVGYGAPITHCYFNNYVSESLSVPPMFPRGTADLRANASPLADNYCGYSSSLNIPAINPAFAVDKTVQGNLDAAPIGSGGTGSVSVDGGTATYTATFRNTGQSTLANPVMYDLLPRIGDTRASSTTPRGSQFAVTLTGIGALPANLTLSYSQAVNPCRPEVLSPNPGCVDDWTTSAPASLADVTALRFAYAGNVQVTTGFSATYTVSTPPSAAGTVAWNSIGTNVTAGDALVGAAESSLTGLRAQSAQPAITKIADRTTVDAVGQEIEFTFTVTNNTAVTLNNVRVTDALVDSAPSSVAPTATCSSLTSPTGSCSGTSTSLAAGQSAIFTATYTTTQADLDHGSVSDQATATATPPSGPSLSNATDVVTVTAVQSGALSLVKSADPESVDSVGDVIDYTFTVRNTGNVTLRNVAITEGAFSGSGALSAISCPTGALAPDATVECTATYPVTQSDLTAGAVTNTATATATVPGGAAVTSSASTATVDVEQTAALELVKSATPSTPATYNEGQVITYSFVVTNTGNVPIEDISIDEVEFTGEGDISAIVCPTDTLAPTEQVTCTATYTLTQADVDSESLTNTAEATGTAPSGSVVSNESSTTTPQIAAPSLTLLKSASTAFVDAAGDAVTYTFTVRNDGNVTVRDIVVEETAFSGSGPAPVVACPSDVLSPGQQLVCTAGYTVTQEDMDGGAFANSARASGVDPSGEDVESNASTAVVTANAAPALSVEKTADVPTFDAVGDEIVFSFLIRNTGNVTLIDIHVDEQAFTGSAALGDIECADDELAPTGEVTCTAEYAVTQADIDAGGLENTALAVGRPRGGDPIGSAPSTATVDAVQTPLLELVKSATPDEADAAGDEVTYTFVVTNGGNVTVTGLSIVESAFSGTGALAAPECAATTVAPGDDATCEVTYVLTQADVDAGVVENTAIAAASAAGVDVESASSDATVTIERAPALTLVKSAEIADPEVIHADDVITYSFVITNTGNVTITDPGVEETAFTGTGPLADPTCADSDPLAPGDQLLCSVTYTVTQDDVDAGQIVNTAVPVGTSPLGAAPPAAPSSSVTVPEPALPSLNLVKSTEATTITAAGQVVTYTFTITNTGNVTARDVTVVEDEFSGHGDPVLVDCPVDATLVPGQVGFCTARYTVVAADLDGTPLTNTATARAGAPDGEAFASDPSTARIEDVAVVRPDGGLAFSGSVIAWGAAALAALAVLGGALLLVVRRRTVS